jgi:hypothetical protein
MRSHAIYLKVAFTDRLEVVTIGADDHLVHIKFALSTCDSEVCMVASGKGSKERGWTYSSHGFVKWCERKRRVGLTTRRCWTSRGRRVEHQSGRFA